MKQHLRMVAESRKNNTVLSSRDTLYCSGNAFACIQIEKSGKDEINSQTLYSKDKSHVMVQIQLLTLTTGGVTEYYNHFTFPAIGKSCDVKTKDKVNGAYTVLCENELLNMYGLDTLKAEVFATVKGPIIKEPVKTRSIDTIRSPKSFIVNRDFNAPLTYEDEEIKQGDVVIGSFEMEIIPGPKGSTRQYKIYNSVGALICTATLSSDPNSPTDIRSWNLLTHKDNRFSTTELTGNPELDTLIKYLIAKKFM